MSSVLALLAGLLLGLIALAAFYLVVAILCGVMIGVWRLAEALILDLKYRR